MNSINVAAGIAWRLCALMVLCLVVVRPSSATNLVLDQAGNIVGSYVGPRSVVADWVYSGGASGGVQASSSGNATVPTKAGNVTVPTTVNARYTAARVAGIAAKVARAGTVVGAGFTAWEIYNKIQESGIQTCPPPAFFCVPGIAPTAPPIHPDAKYTAPGTLTLFDTKEAAAMSRINQIYSNNSCTTLGFNCPTATTSCSESWDAAGTKGSYSCGTNAGGYPSVAGTATSKAPQCPTGMTMSGGTCTGVAEPRPASEPEIADKVGKKAGEDPAYGPDLMKAARGDAQRNPTIIAPTVFAPADLPVDGTADNVQGPSVRKQTDTIVNTDGTTTTRNTDVQTTVTPQTSGTTIQNFEIKYVTTTVTTVTNINNTTNETHVETTTETESGNPDAPAGDQPADGPKECGSPGRPKCAIDELDTPTTKDTVRADDIANKMTIENGKADQAITDVSEGKIGWSWFPQIPTASCVDPQVPNPITGASVKMEWICSTFNLLKAFISACMCFFVIVACVREVQSAMKA